MTYNVQLNSLKEPLLLQGPNDELSTSPTRVANQANELFFELLTPAASGANQANERVVKLLTPAASGANQANERVVELLTPAASGANQANELFFELLTPAASGANQANEQVVEVLNPSIQENEPPRSYPRVRKCLEKAGTYACMLLCTAIVGGSAFGFWSALLPDSDQ